MVISISDNIILSSLNLYQVFYSGESQFCDNTQTGKTWPVTEFLFYVVTLIPFQQESIQRAKEEDEKRKEISQKFQVSG